MSPEGLSSSKTHHNTNSNNKDNDNNSSNNEKDINLVSISDRNIISTGGSGIIMTGSNELNELAALSPTAISSSNILIDNDDQNGHSSRSTDYWNVTWS